MGIKAAQKDRREVGWELVLQGRAEFGCLHLLLILAQPPANTLSHLRDVRSHPRNVRSHPKDATVRDTLGNFSSSTPRVGRCELEGLRVLSGHSSPPDGCGDLLLAPLQAPPTRTHSCSATPQSQWLWASWGWAGPGAQPVVVAQQLLQE